MREWLKRQNWYWDLYHTHGLRIGPKPKDREWNILLLPGMEPPFPRPGYVQIIRKMPAHLAGLSL